MRRAAILAAAAAFAWGCSRPPPGKGTSRTPPTSRVARLREALMATDDISEQVRLRRRAYGLGPEGHDFLIEGIVDRELRSRIVISGWNRESAGAEESFHVSIINGLKFRFVDVAEGRKRELSDLNERLDRRLLSDNAYLRRFIVAWGPGDVISIEDSVDEFSAPDSTPASRKIAHWYLADYGGLRLDYDPTEPPSTMTPQVRDALARFKEKHYEGSWWQVRDRQDLIEPEEFLSRIETAVGRERENLLASFTYWTRGNIDTRPDELRYSCAVMVDGREEAWAKLLGSDDMKLKTIAAGELWKHHSRKHAATVIETVSAGATGAGELTEVRSLVDEGLRPEAILAELTRGDFKWGAWLAGLRPHPSLVPALIARLERRPVEPKERAEGPREPEPRLPFGMRRASHRELTEHLDRQERATAVLALGRSGDGRAVAALAGLLTSDDYRLPGDAARALSELAGSPDLAAAITTAAEPRLLDALGKKGQWVDRRICMALAKVGTRRAVPALEALAGKTVGIWGAPGAARDAIKQILAREGG